MLNAVSKDKIRPIEAARRITRYKGIDTALLLCGAGEEEDGDDDDIIWWPWAFLLVA
jgi:hypothetical protein